MCLQSHLFLVPFRTAGYSFDFWREWVIWVPGLGISASPGYRHFSSGRLYAYFHVTCLGFFGKMKVRGICFRQWSCTWISSWYTRMLASLRTGSRWARWAPRPDRFALRILLFRARRNFFPSSPGACSRAICWQEIYIVFKITRPGGLGRYIYETGSEVLKMVWSKR